jgi:uncharacterized protein YecE (DUF72 family)
MAKGKKFPANLFIGTAGWSLPRPHQERFPTEGTHLERYAQVFNAVEINSSFYRDHRPELYAKWAASVPKNFRFSVKLSRHFTQKMRLAETGASLKKNLQGISQLGAKWGALLVQIPPSLAFEEKPAARFMEVLRKHFAGTIVWEPRHLSWSEKKPIRLLSQYQISKVTADPERCPVSSPSHRPAHYHRLHGSPVIYRSLYPSKFIEKLAQELVTPPAVSLERWVIFDNTMFGFAIENALQLKQKLSSPIDRSYSLKLSH